MNIRPRRNRKSAAIRAMVEETQLGPQHLIYPLFLKDGKNIREEVSSLPGNYRWSIDQLLPEFEKWMNLGIKTFEIRSEATVMLTKTFIYTSSEH